MHAFLPLIAQFGSYLKMGMDYYADLRLAGKVVGPDVVASYLNEQMVDWNPKIGNTFLLDDATRAAGSRFLAGIAVNFATKQV